MFGSSSKIKTLEERIERLEKIMEDGTKLGIAEIFKTITLSKVIKERIAQGLEENTFTLTGANNIYNKAMSLINSASSSILSIWCVPGDEPPFWYNELVEEKLNQGVQLVRIFNLRIPQINIEARKLIKKYEGISNFSLYHTEQVTSEALVVNGKYAILTLPTAGNIRIQSAIYTDNPKLVNAINTWYTEYLMTEGNKITTEEQILSYYSEEKEEQV